MYKGVVLSVLASVTFGVLYIFTQFLKPLNSEEIFAWRMLSTLPFITLFMWWSGDLKYIQQIFNRILKQPSLLIWLVISSLLCTTQLWLFLWGPVNGRGLAVSLGYFLLPLIMVLVGCIIYKEKLSQWQFVAVSLATLGVGHEIWRVGGIAWETVYVALAYPVYFFLRRAFKTDHLGGFWWDLLLVIPVAIYLAFYYSNTINIISVFPYLIFSIIGLGLLSALGLGSYILASRLLPFVIFGLLSYLEPVLLVLVSLMMGERVTPDEWLTYIPIWCAVLVLIIEGVLHIFHQKRKKADLELNMKNVSQELKNK